MKLSRKILNNLLMHCDKKEATLIIGARQTGKTTLLEMIKEHLDKKEQKTYFLTLEDFMILSELNIHPENIFKFIPQPRSSKAYVLIDEIQYLTNPTNFLKLLYDKYANNLKIIATGSSAFYIDEKFKDSLAGRKRIFELYTLDFEEYLLFNHAEELIEELQQIRNDNNYLSYKRMELLRFFADYLVYGGYPSVALESNNEEKKMLLKELINSYVKKDMLEGGVKHQDKFLKLMLILAHQVGSLININELSNTIGLSTSAVQHYLNILEKSFHISLVRPYYNNIRKELTKMQKLFFNDLGLRNALINNFNLPENREDKGAILENYVYNRLRALYGKDSIRFWRTTDGNEVDFIYTSNSFQFGIEVKFQEKEFKPARYKKFHENYPQITLRCMAYQTESNKNHVLSL